MCNEPHTASPGRHLEPGLYVVATPIGNRGDLSPRARATLEGAALVLAEDTRSLLTLLGREANLSGKSLNLTEYNVTARIPVALETAATSAVALISDAGTPGIADPGARLVAAAHKSGVPVRPIPGPSALAAALSVSGFDIQRAIFLGFLPRKGGERASALREAAGNGGVLVIYESPSRASATLDAIADVLGDPAVVVCRELSKAFEEVVPGHASELAERFREGRGEFTIVVHVEPPAADDRSRTEARALLSMMKRAGARHSAAAAEVARFTGIRRAQAHELWDEVDS